MAIIKIKVFYGKIKNTMFNYILFTENTLYENVLCTELYKQIISKYTWKYILYKQN